MYCTVLCCVALCEVCGGKHRCSFIPCVVREDNTVLNALLGERDWGGDQLGARRGS